VGIIFGLSFNFLIFILLADGGKITCAFGYSFRGAKKPAPDGVLGQSRKQVAFALAVFILRPQADFQIGACVLVNQLFLICQGQCGL